LKFDEYLDQEFCLICILQSQKYLSFSEESRNEITKLNNTNVLEIRDILIKLPNNPAKLLEAKAIIYKGL
jgi:hypothetical protein